VAWFVVPLLLAPGCAGSLGGSATTPEYANRCSRLFSSVVHDGSVDYEKLRAHQDRVSCQKAIAGTSPDHLDAPARLVFWINVYNLISILKLSDDPGRWSPRQDGRAIFSDERIRIGMRSYSLDEIEHVEMAKLHPDPRVEFLLSCGSRGCSLLPPVLVTRANYEQLLTDGVVRFFGQQWNLEVDWESKTIFTSQLLAPDWHGKDFAGTGRTVEALIAAELRRRGDERSASALLDGTLSLRYRPYDWRVNRVVRQFGLP
jgi:hypothetical protein